MGGMKVSASQNFMDKCKKTFSLKRQRSSEKIKDDVEEDKENIAPSTNEEDSSKPANNTENNSNLITKFKQAMNFKGKPKKKAKIEEPQEVVEETSQNKSDDEPAVEDQKAEELPKIEDKKEEEKVEVEESTQEPENNTIAEENNSESKVEVAEEAVSTTEQIAEPETLVTSSVQEVVAN